jgi:hypothetical protein
MLYGGIMNLTREQKKEIRKHKDYDSFCTSMYCTMCPIGENKKISEMCSDVYGKIKSEPVNKCEECALDVFKERCHKCIHYKFLKDNFVKKKQKVKKEIKVSINNGILMSKIGEIPKNIKEATLIFEVEE